MTELLLIINASAFDFKWHNFPQGIGTLDCHFRVNSRPGNSFGIDIAQQDTFEFQRIEVKLPSFWNDDANEVVTGQLIFSTSREGTFHRDSVKKISIIPSTPKTAEVSIKLTGEPINALLEVGDRFVCFDSPIKLPQDVSNIRFFDKGSSEILRNIVNCAQIYVPASADFDSIAGLYKYLTESGDPNEGIWLFYDRTTQPLRADSHGEYILATVKGENGYDVIYLGDSENISSGWKPMMVKSNLIPNHLAGVFDAVWYDRKFQDIGSRVSAVIEGDFLTFTFPYWKVSLRFNRLPKTAYDTLIIE